MLTLAAGCGAARGPEATGTATVAVPDSLSDRMYAAKLADTLAAILRAGVRDSAFPGAIALVGTKNGVAVVVDAPGSLDWSASPVTDAIDVVGPRVADQGRRPDERDDAARRIAARSISTRRCSRYIPEFQGKWKDAVTVRHLLTHSSGLPAWRPLYKEAESPAAALALAIATPLDTMPGVRMVYYDLGAIISATSWRA